MVRDFGTRNLRNFSLDLAVFPSDSEHLDDLEAFLEDIRVQGSPFWLVEPETRTVRQAPLWPAPDGSRTTFIRPFLAAGGADEVFVDGLSDAGSFTEHETSNFLTDDMANAVEGTLGLLTAGTCTLARSTAIAATGRTSVKINPSTPYAGAGVITDLVALPASMTTGYNDITGHAAVWGEGTFEVTVETHTAGGGIVTSQSETVVGAPGRWVTVTATAPAPPAIGIAFAKVKLVRTTTEATDYFVGCLGIAPGDLESWFLPSSAIPVIEFGTARAAEAILEASGEGYPVARVRLETSSPSWRFHGAGHHYPGSLDLVEEFE
jgi:hypothetical protein